MFANAKHVQRGYKLFVVGNASHGDLALNGSDRAMSRCDEVSAPAAATADVVVAAAAARLDKMMVFARVLLFTYAHSTA